MIFGISEEILLETAALHVNPEPVRMRGRTVWD